MGETTTEKPKTGKGSRGPRGPRVDAAKTLEGVRLLCESAVEILKGLKEGEIATPNNHIMGQIVAYERVLDKIGAAK